MSAKRWASLITDLPFLRRLDFCKGPECRVRYCVLIYDFREMTVDSRRDAAFGLSPITNLVQTAHDGNRFPRPHAAPKGYYCIVVYTSVKMVKKRVPFRPLDRRSGVPFYLQIQQSVLEQIRSGTLSAGSSLPSEHDIARMFRVSRMTGRHALKALSDLGVTYTLWGKGTFVSSAKLEKDVRQVASFTDEMRSMGLRPGSQLLSCENILADEEAASVLRISKKDEVVSIRRIRYANSSPMALEWSRIPRHFCPDLVDKFQPGESLYAALYEHYGIRMHVADEIVEAGLASDEVVKLLHADRKGPVFLFTRTSYLPSGEPIEFVKSVYRGDRYKIVNRLTRVRSVGLADNILPLAR